MTTTPVCRIKYPEEFQRILNQLEEYRNHKVYSLESLNLSREALEYNMANYTIWAFRRDVLKVLTGASLHDENSSRNVFDPKIVPNHGGPSSVEINKGTEDKSSNDSISGHDSNAQAYDDSQDEEENSMQNENQDGKCTFESHDIQKIHPLLDKELRWLEDVIQENEKNYQVWFHRQCIIDWIGNADEEKVFINEMIASDSKNYHAWQYRQWIVRRFNLWDDELEDCERLLEKDIRNNSAWNNRFFVLRNTTLMDRDTRMKEIDFAFARILKSPSNEAAWCYACGMAKYTTATTSLMKCPSASNEKFTEIDSNSKDYAKKTSDPNTHSFVDKDEERRQVLDHLEGHTVKFLDRSPFNVFGCTTLLYILENKCPLEAHHLTKCLDLCDTLITSDSIRKAYWNYKKESITGWLEKLLE